MPAPSSTAGRVDNWRLTGDTRTHYRLGGALLLTEWVQAAAPGANVQGPKPCRPAVLSCEQPPDQPLTPGEFLKIAERLTRDEIVHSLLGLDLYRAVPEAKDRDTIRISQSHGFSGPKTGEPSLQLLPPEDPGSTADIVVLDDTGNRFRRSPSQWPDAVTQGDATGRRVIVYKLHRPLPCQATTANSDPAQPSAGDKEPGLWHTVLQRYPEQRLVIVSIDDLRDKDAPISRGLSWERTALDLVWQLLNVEAFAPLRDCTHLIVRLGLDGAVYWHRSKGEKGYHYSAWLIYEPTGIEGTAQNACEGQMVGYGSVFTAAIVKPLAEADPASRLAPVKDKDGKISAPPQCIEAGIKAGLLASRRLLRLGFGKDVEKPDYPKGDLFQGQAKGDLFFACQRIPIIPHSVVPDRGYWRLLDSIFQDKTALLHRAVALTATGAKAVEPDDKAAELLLREVPIAVFAKALRAYDRREIENYRALYSLLHDYIKQSNPPRPLSVAVFGPPGAGKSFGVKMVAKALGQTGASRSIETLTFNLSQYQDPDQLAAAFHLVRDLVLRGKIPLVFFDEFDTALGGTPLGWLRYFLAPMQDAEFLDRGTPHPIGQAIFVFAGGTCSTYADFAKPFTNKAADEKERKAFNSAKGPDFLSRLRSALDIPGLDLNSPFDPYGPVDVFPCEPAILLRRAGILAYQLSEKAPLLRDSAKALRVSPVVLRALLHLPQFEHGNRSFEALLDMSHLPGATNFTPALLPPTGLTGLHANPTYLSHLLATDYPFPPEDRTLIAREIHKHYLEQRKAKGEYKPDKPSHQAWEKLDRRYIVSNELQADDIARKLRLVGLWFRKNEGMTPGQATASSLTPDQIEKLARLEHERWVASQRSAGYIYGPTTDEYLRTHHCLLKWDDPSLPATEKEKDLDAIRALSRYLAAANHEIITS